jgi:multiple sugar transport system substrate-binding protein
MKIKQVVIGVLSLCALQQVCAVELKYMLWDSNQKPAYEKCAADFQKENPGIQIKISQSAWPDYWQGLQKSLETGSAPDVFTNHLSQYPGFVKKKQILDLKPLIERDGVFSSVYFKGLYQVWGKDGKQYGLPKDWDTIAMIVNMDMAKKAGVTVEELRQMTWNPKDGGSFGQIIAKLTQDAKGRNALNAQFDPAHVRVYGYQIPALGGMAGQIEWSHFAISNGFKFQDKPWDDKFYFDSPKLVETMDWLAKLPRKGISAPVGKFGESENQFLSGKVAMVPNGSWMVNHFREKSTFPTEWVPLPIGPTGSRATMFNGLSDAIWTGTKHKEESWRWVKYLASEQCQSVVADAGIVFPAINKLVNRALAAQNAKGSKSSAFLEMTTAKTFMAPMANNGQAVNEVMNKAFESIYKNNLGQADIQATLKTANAEAIRLVKQ